jgi:hypothetical protein
MRVFLLEWRSSAVGFQLQLIPNLTNAVGWQIVSDQPVLTNSVFQVNMAPPFPQAFFRLIKP